MTRDEAGLLLMEYASIFHFYNKIETPSYEEMIIWTNKLAELRNKIIDQMVENKDAYHDSFVA